jgi:hypothetical protein
MSREISSGPHQSTSYSSTSISIIEIPKKAHTEWRLHYPTFMSFIASWYYCERLKGLGHRFGLNPLAKCCMIQSSACCGANLRLSWGNFYVQLRPEELSPREIWLFSFQTTPSTRPHSSEKLRVFPDNNNHLAYHQKSRPAILCLNSRAGNVVVWGSARLKEMSGSRRQQRWCYVILQLELRVATLRFEPRPQKCRMNQLIDGTHSSCPIHHSRCNTLHPDLPWIVLEAMPVQTRKKFSYAVE